MTKRFPVLVTKWLESVPMDELNFLANLAMKKESDVFRKFLKGEAERRKNIIYLLPEGDPVKLAIEKAALRGGVEAMSTIFDMIQASPLELEKRLSKEDDK